MGHQSRRGREKGKGGREGGRGGQFQQVVLALSLSRVTASICSHARATHAINGAFSRAAAAGNRNWVWNLGCNGKKEGRGGERKSGCCNRERLRNLGTPRRAEGNILCTLECLPFLTHPFPCPYARSQSRLIIVGGEGTWQRGGASIIPVRQACLPRRYVLS